MASCKICRKSYFEKNKLLNLNNEIEKISSKKCSKCQEEKDIEHFDGNIRTKTGYDYWCRSCRRKYYKDNYHKNIFRSRKRTNNYRAKRLQWFNELKIGKPCADCGLTYEPNCMDFDHVRGVKVKSVSFMVLKNTPKNKILEEIKKCDLVCILCHGDRTNKRMASTNKYSNRVLRNINIINDAKSKPCTICKIQYASHNMQFDHIDHVSKYRNISQLKNSSIKILLTEIEKCQILCALCHRRKSLFEQSFKNFIRLHIAETNNLMLRHKVREKVFLDIENKKKGCSRCQEILPFSNFGKNKRTKSGLNSWCKPCLNKYKREKRIKK